MGRILPNFVSACGITVEECELEPILQAQVGHHKAQQAGQMQLLARGEHTTHVPPTQNNPTLI